MTDNPQILSGSTLAILDPHHDFTSSGGAKFNFTEHVSQYADHLLSFDFFLSRGAQSRAFPGSIIRLPLRKLKAGSSISAKSVDAREIRQLFEDFIKEELDIELLFLKNVGTIEIHEIDWKGNRVCIAKASVTKAPLNETKDEHITTFKCTVAVETPTRGKVEKQWRVVYSQFPSDHASTLLATRSPGADDVQGVLAKHKLRPEIGMAFQIPLSNNRREDSGRLFTYLPLPIRTGFPAHVHGLFALTQSRQHLANSGEVGLVRGSDDR